MSPSPGLYSCVNYVYNKYRKNNICNHRNPYLSLGLKALLACIILLLNGYYIFIRKKTPIQELLFGDSENENGEELLPRHRVFLLQSNPFEELKRFTEWCNSTEGRKARAENTRTSTNDTEPKEYANYTSFSTYLIKNNFKKFERLMNEELALVNESFAGPAWVIDNYKMFIALSFCPLADFFEVTTDEETPHGNIAHLMVPTDENIKDKTAYILNYGMSDTEENLRLTAKRGLRDMVAKGIGVDLQQFVPQARILYRIFIGFFGPEGAVEVSGPTTLVPPTFNYSLSSTSSPKQYPH